MNTLAQLIAYLRPFARPGLQVLLINASRPSRFIETILDALDLDNSATEETFWGVHFRFRYTSEDTQGQGGKAVYQKELKYPDKI